MGRYDHLIHKFEKQYNFWGDFMPEYQAYFRGHDCMPDSNFYSSYRAYMKEAFCDRTPNFHTEEEYLCFTGYDMTDPWGSFDAEIEFWIGKDLNNLEQHFITKPTIIRIPPYTWHCPIEYRRVGKPVYFQVCCMRGKFGPFFYQFKEDDNYEIQYIGSAGAKKCNLDPSKQCTFCGKCWKDTLPPDEPQTAVEAAEKYRKAQL